MADVKEGLGRESTDIPENEFAVESLKAKVEENRAARGTSPRQAEPERRTPWADSGAQIKEQVTAEPEETRSVQQALEEGREREPDDDKPDTFTLTDEERALAEKRLRTLDAQEQLEVNRGTALDYFQAALSNAEEEAEYDEDLLEEPTLRTAALILRGVDETQFREQTEILKEQRLADLAEDSEAYDDSEYLDAQQEILNEHEEFLAEIEAAYVQTKGAFDSKRDLDLRVQIWTNRYGDEAADAATSFLEFQRQLALPEFARNLLGESDRAQWLVSYLTRDLAEIPTSELNDVLAIRDAIEEEALAAQHQEKIQATKRRVTEAIAAAPSTDVSAGLREGNSQADLANAIREQNAIMREDDPPPALSFGRIVARAVGVNPDLLEGEAVQDHQGEMVPLLTRLAQEPSNPALIAHARKLQTAVNPAQREDALTIRKNKDGTVSGVAFAEHSRNVAEGLTLNGKKTTVEDALARGRGFKSAKDRAEHEHREKIARLNALPGRG